MHELGVTKSIADAVVRFAEEAGARQVLGVHLIVGEMRNLEEEWVQRYFARCAKGTVAADAVVNIERVPIAFLCNVCGATFALDIRKDERMHCAHCGSDSFEMICGQELLIKDIEVA